MGNGPGPQVGMQRGNELLFGPQMPGQFGSFSPMMDPMLMTVLLEQFTHGHAPPGQAQLLRPGAQQHYPQTPPSNKEGRTGLQTSGWEAYGMEESEAETEPPAYQSTGFRVPDRGAARRYPPFQDMQSFARERGSRDSSLIPPRSSQWEDQATMGRLDHLTHLSGGELAEAILQASPEQRERITEGETRLEALLREEEEHGHPVPMTRQRMMFAQNLEDLHQQGLVDPQLGQRNREYMELLETRDRSAIDYGLKHGYGPPVGADPAQVQESAFNAERRPARQPAAANPVSHERMGVREIKLDKWGEGKNSSTWGALRSAGWSDKEIIEQKLVDRVAELNGLEDPAKVLAGQTLKVPTRGGQGGEQQGALYEADGGPAHRTPTWEQKPAPAAKTQATGPSKPTQSAPAAPAEEKKAPPYDPSKDATALYKSMNGGLLGAGTDEDALFKALEGKTPDQIKAIRAHYKDHYDRDLDKDLAGDLSGKELSRAQELLNGNQAAADADKLNHAMKGGFLGAGTDEEAIHKTFEGKTEEQRKAILDEYQKRNNGVALGEHLKQELSGAELDRANALIEGNQAKADAAAMRHAMKGGFLGMGTDEQAVYQALEGKDKTQREAILKAYSDQYEGADLRQDIQGELSKAELDRANALLDGNKTAADAAALEHATRGGTFGPDKDAIYQAFQGKSEEERQALRAAYEDKYGSLDTALQSQLIGNDLEKANKLIQNGQLTDAERLKYAMEGAGTDEDEIKAVLGGKSKAEIDALRADYQALTNRELDGDLESDLSGRDAFDAQMDLKGRPTSAEEAVDRQNERWQYERGGWGNTISRLFVDGFSDKGELLDRNTARANDQLERVEQLRYEGRHAEAAEAEQRLSQLVDYASDDVATYREAKDSAAETAGTVAATAASVAVVVGTAGTATPLVVAGLAATAGAGAKVMTSGAIQGQGYGWEGALSDAGTGAIDGVATAVGAKAGAVAAQSVGKAMTRQAATQTGTGATRSLGTRVAMGATEGAVDGTVGGALGGAGATAANEGTWKDGLEEGLKRVGTGTAMGAGLGLAAGGVVGGAIPAGGAAIQKTGQLSGQAADWSRQKLANAGDALRTGGERLRQAGKDFYDFGMEGGLIGKRLRANADNVPAAPVDAPVPPRAEPVGPRADQPVAPKADQPVAPKADEPVAPKADEPVAPKADEPVAPKADEPVAPKADEPVAPRPDQPVTPKADEPVTPPPVKPDPPPQPKPGMLRRWFEFGMEGGVIGKWLKDNPGMGLGKLGEDIGGVIGKLNDKSRVLLENMGIHTDDILGKTDPPPLPRGQEPPVLPKGQEPPPLPRGEEPPVLPKGQEPAGPRGDEPALPKGQEPPALPKAQVDGPEPPRIPTRAELDDLARKRLENFPDHTLMARFQDQASFTQLDPQQQLTVLEMAARHKPEQPTGLLQRLFGGSNDGPSAMEGHLHRLMQDGKLNLKDVNGNTLLDNLDALDRQVVARGLNQRALSEEVAATVANPAACIRQGKRGTCSATTVQYIHATSDPADYVRVMRGLTDESGEVTLQTGKKLTRPDSALPADDSGRRTADRIYQTSAMNHASGRYDNNILQPDGRGGHVGPDGSFSYDGLTPKQGNELLNDFLAGNYEARDVGDVLRLVGRDSPDGQRVIQKFEDHVRAMRAQGEPVHVGMQFANGQHSRHAVSVENVDDQFVYIRNQWDMHDQNLYSSSQVRREALGEGRSRIRRDEFYARLEVYQKRLTPEEVAWTGTAEKIAHHRLLFPDIGDDLSSPAVAARFQDAYPGMRISQLSAEDRVAFFHGFDQRLKGIARAHHRAEGTIEEAVAGMNEFMKQYGYDQGDFVSRAGVV